MADEAVIEHSYWEAQYEYVGAKDDDLNLAVGDVVTVVQQNDDGWWYGYLGEKEGYFPNNYVFPYVEKKEETTAETTQDTPAVTPAADRKMDKEEKEQLKRERRQTMSFEKMQKKQEAKAKKEEQRRQKAEMAEKKKQEKEAEKRNELQKKLDERPPLTGVWMRVLFPLEPAKPEHLWLSEGDLFELSDPNETEGWMVGYRAGYGSFPKSYCEECEAPSDDKIVKLHAKDIKERNKWEKHWKKHDVEAIEEANAKKEQLEKEKIEKKEEKKAQRQRTMTMRKNETERVRRLRKAEKDAKEMKKQAEKKKAEQEQGGLGMLADVPDVEPFADVEEADEYTENAGVWIRALMDWKPREDIDKHLNLKTNDILVLVEAVEDDMARGWKDGMVGLYPANLTEEYEPTEEEIEIWETKNRQFSHLRNFARLTWADQHAEKVKKIQEIEEKQKEEEEKKPKEDQPPESLSVFSPPPQEPSPALTDYPELPESTPSMETPVLFVTKAIKDWTPEDTERCLAVENEDSLNILVEAKENDDSVFWIFATKDGSAGWIPRHSTAGRPVTTTPQVTKEKEKKKEGRFFKRVTKGIGFTKKDSSKKGGAAKKHELFDLNKIDFDADMNDAMRDVSYEVVRALLDTPPSMARHCEMVEATCRSTISINLFLSTRALVSSAHFKAITEVLSEPIEWTFVILPNNQICLTVSFDKGAKSLRVSTRCTDQAVDTPSDTLIDTPKDTPNESPTESPDLTAAEEAEALAALRDIQDQDGKKKSKQEEQEEEEVKEEEVKEEEEEKEEVKEEEEEREEEAKDEIPSSAPALPPRPGRPARPIPPPSRTPPPVPQVDEDEKCPPPPPRPSK